MLVTPPPNAEQLHPADAWTAPDPALTATVDVLEAIEHALGGLGDALGDALPVALRHKVDEKGPLCGVIC